MAGTPQSKPANHECASEMVSLPSSAYHKHLSGEAGSLKLPTVLSIPCSMYHELFTGTRPSSYPPFPSVNSDPIAAKLACVAYPKRAGVYSHTLGTALFSHLLKTPNEAALTVRLLSVPMETAKLLSHSCLYLSRGKKRNSFSSCQQ